MRDDEGYGIQKRVAAGVLAVVAITLAGIVLLGSQVSGVLSTVGASVGPPPAQPGGGADTAGDAPGGEAGGVPGGRAGGDGEAATPGGPNTILLSLDRPDLLIVKTGTVAIQVGGLDAAIEEATVTIAGLGGYASGSERGGDGDGASARITYRVPAARWEDALAAVRGLGQKVLAEQSSTEEVTGQVADLGARIRNLEATERALQAIMDRAEAIKDVLTVQAELTKVRGEIEQLVTQKTHLEAEAAMSTLTVTFSLRPDPVLVAKEAYDAGVEVEAATASLVDILQAGLTAGIWLGIVWTPVLGTLGLALGIALLVVRRVRRSDRAEVALRP